MKVFDIVKVTTNGNFDTQVIANQMFTSAFGNSNQGLGGALATILFISVLPDHVRQHPPHAVGPGLRRDCHDRPSSTKPIADPEKSGDGKTGASTASCAASRPGCCG